MQVTQFSKDFKFVQQLKLKRI